MVKANIPMHDYFVVKKKNPEKNKSVASLNLSIIT